MPFQSGHVSKLRLCNDAQQARHENSRDIRMFLEESELRILPRISRPESETGLKQVYTIIFSASISVILNASLS